MTPTTCISLVAALKKHVFDGDGHALMAEWKSLTAKDKDDLVAWFNAEGIEVARLS